MTDAQADIPTPERRRRAMPAEEQCDVMAQHGVTFQKCSREDAKRFLQDNTYQLLLNSIVDFNQKRDEGDTYAYPAAHSETAKQKSRTPRKKACQQKSSIRPECIFFDMMSLNYLRVCPGINTCRAHQ